MRSNSTATTMQYTELQFPDNRVLKCAITTYPAIDDALKEDLSKPLLSVFGTWTHADISAPTHLPLTIVHALAGEQGPIARLFPDKRDAAAMAEFNKFHQKLGTLSALIIRLGQREVVFVPVKTKEDATTTTRIFWGYSLVTGMLPVGCHLLQYSRLAVVFDLDETLVQSHSDTTLKRVIDKIEKKRLAQQAAVAAARGDGERDAAQDQLALVEAELGALRADLALLTSYKTSHDSSVTTDNGTVFAPSMEVATFQGTQVRRPIVRIDTGGGRYALFTRVDPRSASTSMIIRPREGWLQLRDYLNGQEEFRRNPAIPPKLRWEVFICTTAEREYALEVWRLLDPDWTILKPEDLGKRLVNVTHTQPKQLQAVLARTFTGLASGKDVMRDPNQPVVQLSVAVDDREEVWGTSSRPALLQVLAFHPHREFAAMQLGGPERELLAATQSAEELARVREALIRLRSDIYKEIVEVVRPNVERLVGDGVAEPLQASDPANVVPPCLTVASILAELPRPTTLVDTNLQMRASDERLEAANDAADAAADLAPRPTPAAPAPAAVRPSDPRRRGSTSTEPAAAATEAGKGGAGDAGGKRPADGAAAAAAAGGGGGLDPRKRARAAGAADVAEAVAAPAAPAAAAENTADPRKRARQAASAAAPAAAAPASNAVAAGNQQQVAGEGEEDGQCPRAKRSRLEGDSSTAPGDSAVAQPASTKPLTGAAAWAALQQQTAAVLSDPQVCEYLLSQVPPAVRQMAAPEHLLGALGVVVAFMRAPVSNLADRHQLLQEVTSKVSPQERALVYALLQRLQEPGPGAEAASWIESLSQMSLAQSQVAAAAAVPGQQAAAGAAQPQQQQVQQGAQVGGASNGPVGGFPPPPGAPAAAPPPPPAAAAAAGGVPQVGRIAPQHPAVPPPPPATAAAAAAVGAGAGAAPGSEAAAAAGAVSHHGPHWEMHGPAWPLPPAPRSRLSAQELVRVTEYKDVPALLQALAGPDGRYEVKQEEEMSRPSATGKEPSRGFLVTVRLERQGRVLESHSWAPAAIKAYRESVKKALRAAYGVNWPFPPFLHPVNPAMLQAGAGAGAGPAAGPANGQQQQPQQPQQQQQVLVRLQHPGVPQHPQQQFHHPQQHLQQQAGMPQFNPPAYQGQAAAAAAPPAPTAAAAAAAAAGANGPHAAAEFSSVLDALAASFRSNPGPAAAAAPQQWAGFPLPPAATAAAGQGAAVAPKVFDLRAGPAGAGGGAGAQHTQQHQQQHQQQNHHHHQQQQQHNHTQQQQQPNDASAPGQGKKRKNKKKSQQQQQQQQPRGPLLPSMQQHQPQSAPLGLASQPINQQLHHQQQQQKLVQGLQGQQGPAGQQAGQQNQQEGAGQRSAQNNHHQQQQQTAPGSPGRNARGAGPPPPPQLQLMQAAGTPPGRERHIPRLGVVTLAGGNLAQPPLAGAGGGGQAGAPAAAGGQQQQQQQPVVYDLTASPAPKASGRSSRWEQGPAPGGPAGGGAGAGEEDGGAGAGGDGGRRQRASRIPLAAAAAAGNNGGAGGMHQGQMQQHQQQQVQQHQQQQGQQQMQQHQHQQQQQTHQQGQGQQQGQHHQQQGPAGAGFMGQPSRLQQMGTALGGVMVSGAAGVPAAAGGQLGFQGNMFGGMMQFLPQQQQQQQQPQQQQQQQQQLMMGMVAQMAHMVQQQQQQQQQQMMRPGMVQAGVAPNTFLAGGRSPLQGPAVPSTQGAVPMGAQWQLPAAAVGPAGVVQGQVQQLWQQQQQQHPMNNMPQGAPAGMQMWGNAGGGRQVVMGQLGLAQALPLAAARGHQAYPGMQQQHAAQRPMRPSGR